MQTQIVIPQIARHEFRQKSTGETLNVVIRSIEETCLDRLFGYKADDYEATGVITHVEFKWGKLASEIAAELGKFDGKTWGIKPNNHEYVESAFNLTREDGLSLYFYGPDHSHKAAHNFSFNPPQYENGGYVSIYGMKNPSINVGVGKNVEQIARDITRRLIPDAEKAFVLVTARIASEKEASDNKKVNTRLIAAILGANAHHNEGNNSESVIYGESFTARIIYGGSIKFETRYLDKDLAIKVAKALNEVLKGTAA